MKANNLIPPETTIVSALKIMDSIGQKLLIIVEGEKFVGVLSIGDIQRAIINQKNLDAPVTEILRSIITVANVDESEESIRRKMIELRTESMPVIDDDGIFERRNFLGRHYRRRIETEKNASLRSRNNYGRRQRNAAQTSD